ncbi:unnamed protein product [Durusdinium trenchii]|uniref:UDP-glucuronosyl/UDP-glucosyltransferase n=1 Tax=Durusdinium trenchii TaxID=1381693 RepID=A0ABP0RE14_9DINO
MSRPVSAFVFPGRTDHVEPSLLICRNLVSLGWQIEYVCEERYEEQIRDAGAAFHDIEDLCTAHGLDLKRIHEDYEDPTATWSAQFGSIATERLIPVFKDFFKTLSPKVVVYCPILCGYAHFAATCLKIVDVSVLTRPGPGFLNAELAKNNETPAGLIEKIRANLPNAKAIEQVRRLLQKPNLSLNSSEPLVHENYTHLNLVTSLQSLADPLTEKDACVFFAQGKKFEFVGPLMKVDRKQSFCIDQDLAHDISQAMRNKKDIILVSLMHPTPSSELGEVLCRTICKACGPGSSLVADPLVIFSIASQLDFDDKEASWPENCRTTEVPSVELLKLAEPTLFITHGSQTDFMESLSVGSPLIICPSSPDHAEELLNASRVQHLGVGEKVIFTGDLVAYEAQLWWSLEQLLGTGTRRSFRLNAQLLAEEIRDSGGTDRASELIQDTAPRSKRATVQSRISR